MVKYLYYTYSYLIFIYSVFNILQGISYWNGTYELALTDKDMQVEIGLNMVLECWDREFFGTTTIFQKNNISWPQQPPTEKVLKFNMIFHDSTKKIVFQNIKMKVSVYFWGLGIWVSSTSFQKSNKDWPQQPPTEKVLKFNMSFHDSVKTFFFQNSKIKYYWFSDYWI